MSREVSSAVAKFASWAHVHIVLRGRDGEDEEAVGFGELEDEAEAVDGGSGRTAVATATGTFVTLLLFATGIVEGTSDALSLIVIGSWYLGIDQRSILLTTGTEGCSGGRGGTAGVGLGFVRFLAGSGA